MRAEAAAAFAAEGGVACATLAEMARACDVIVSVVVNAQQTEAVLFGDGGLAGDLQPGSVFVMCSTVDPNWSVALEAGCRRWACTIWTRRSRRRGAPPPAR